MFSVKENVRTLRSSAYPHLEIPRTRTVGAERDFAVRAPKLWEKLPDGFKVETNLSNLKKVIKTDSPFTCLLGNPAKCLMSY